MKKLTDFFKPNVLIIFGALLFIYFLNYLSYGGAGTALGIIAIVMAAYYLFVGIVSVLMNNKFTAQAQKLIEVISVSFFVLFMFVDYLLVTINVATAMGPTAWTIKILSMIASLAFVAFYCFDKFMSKPLLSRLSYLFALIFVLSLLLDLLFGVGGDSRALGDIDVLLVVIYGVYAYYLFNSIQRLTEEPKTKETEETKE